MSSGIQTTVNANEPSCVEMASIMVSWLTCYKLVKVPFFSKLQKFCGVGIVYGSNIFILKSQN